MGLVDFFTRRQRHVQHLLADYLATWLACINAFEDAWSTYMSQGLGESFDFKVAQTHKEESKADDLRRKIELDLYSKALLPESRGDILGLLETGDRLLTEAEWVLYEVQLQELQIPVELRPNFQRLIEVVHGCCASLHDGMKTLLVDGLADDVLPHCDRVDTLESESDHLERVLIRQIFKRDDTAVGNKVLLKNLVMLLARVTDRAENVADRITLISVKRRV